MEKFYDLLAIFEWRKENDAICLPLKLSSTKNPGGLWEPALVL
jgi:hypothetical protein